ncbi:MAG: flagellar type III secretion system pore protein FliP [Planctomycetes bacterium]|nr:flagellar type III secretion system pore protein FliP [Planctomycetota bacterium]
MNTITAFEHTTGTECRNHDAAEVAREKRALGRLWLRNAARTSWLAFAAVLAALLFCGRAFAQGAELQGPPSPDMLQQGMQSLVGGEGRPATAIEIALLLTLLSILPAILVTITSFTRIVIVLSFVRRALSVNELPPNPVIIGLALFLTTFVMGPVAGRIYHNAYEPYKAGVIGMEDAGGLAWVEMSGFLVANTRANEIQLFAEMAKVEIPPDAKPEDLPMRVVVPAFVLSELKTAFQMGFLLFLPFLVIDLVVSSVLLSMGMFMLPPVMISTPFKLLVFVLVDGWGLVCHSLVASFVTD